MASRVSCQTQPLRPPSLLWRLKWWRFMPVVRPPSIRARLLSYVVSERKFALSPPDAVYCGAVCIGKTANGEQSRASHCSPGQVFTKRDRTWSYYTLNVSTVPTEWTDDVLLGPAGRTDDAVDIPAACRYRYIIWRFYCYGLRFHSVCNKYSE